MKRLGVGTTHDGRTPDMIYFGALAPLGQAA
jgi:hypothetical protein